MSALVRTRDLTKDYVLGGSVVHALSAVSLSIEAGQMVAVMGPSGSGKSTLMNLLGCLDRPTSGQYWLEDRDVSTLDADALALVRNQRIGFVFQQFNLLPRSSALDNVALPLLYAGLPAKQRRARAAEALEQVGLADRMGHLPTQLSGGQQQRVAIARALCHRPALILADEPTGALDSATSAQIMALLQALNQQGMTLVCVTHEREVAACAGRLICFKDGQVVSDTQQLPRPAALLAAGAVA
ncbi:MAG TPA: ABC transporter ATP-binding protein [Burkholderiaceae bacterium]|nr:ABC transporter ATP-binding protein [Burkholderiaceae bacterium]